MAILATSRRRLRIVSDGIGATTRIVDVETGEEILTAYEIDLHIGINKPNTAVIKTLLAQADVVCDAEIECHCQNDYRASVQRLHGNLIPANPVITQ